MINCIGQFFMINRKHDVTVPDMTFSILARDPQSGAIGGAAATGNLCVGAWVLRGDVAAGMSASQGAAPSTLWGEDVLARMRAGLSPAAAVAAVTGPDSGREWRQLTALDTDGRSGAFTGRQNGAERGALEFPGGVVAGNILSGPEVLEAMVEAFLGQGVAPFAERLMLALRGARRAGGDSRGLLSAALLVLRRDAPPLSLRVDHDDAPLTALSGLYDRATTGEYAQWVRHVPCPEDPYRRMP